MRNNDLRLVVDTFKFFYKSVNSKEHYIFKMTESRKSLINKFCEEFLEHYRCQKVQKDILQKFMEFQFNYWYKQDSKFGQGVSIQLEWIIGSKAWKRWLELEGDSKKKKVSEFKIKKGIKKDVKYQVRGDVNIGLLEHLMEVNEIEEFEKEMFFNTSKGFINCQNNTALYNHKSKFCMGCKFKDKCKTNLRETLPTVNSRRGYK